MLVRCLMQWKDDNPCFYYSLGRLFSFWVNSLRISLTTLHGRLLCIALGGVLVCLAVELPLTVLLTMTAPHRLL